MNLEKGCNYCSNLKCTDDPPELLENFTCTALAWLRLLNAGACFVVKDQNIIIENCPKFKGKDQP